MQGPSIYDLIILQSYFANKKEPTDREKAVAAHLDAQLLAIAESSRLVGPLPQ